MPFKKATADTVATGNEITANQAKPISQEGLNPTNLPGYYPDPATTTAQEQAKRHAEVVKSAHALDVSTAKLLADHRKRGPADYGLVKPTIEEIPKPEDQMSQLDNEIAQLVIDKIWNCIWYLRIAHFFTQPGKGETTPLTPQQRLQATVNKATRHDYQMCMELYKIPTIDIATDLSVLCLFDVIMLIDDSGSMNISGTRDMQGNLVSGGTEDYDPTDNNDMTRWDLAALLLKVGAQVMTMFDDDGISVRFFNKKSFGGAKIDGITTSGDVDSLYRSIGKPNGGTYIGRAITDAFDQLVARNLAARTLSKPVLFVCYTDGVSSDCIKTSVRNIRRQTRTSPYGSKSILFSFSQVGNDKPASDALEELDSDPDSKAKGPDGVEVDAEDGAGDITDCTSMYKNEKAQYDKAQLTKPMEERVPYTEIFHTMKSWLGPLMEKYDKADETPSTGGIVGAAKSVFGFV